MFYDNQKSPMQCPIMWFRMAESSSVKWMVTPRWIYFNLHAYRKPRALLGEPQRKKKNVNIFGRFFFSVCKIYGQLSTTQGAVLQRTTWEPFTLFLAFMLMLAKNPFIIHKPIKAPCVPILVKTGLKLWPSSPNIPISMSLVVRCRTAPYYS